MEAYKANCSFGLTSPMEYSRILNSEQFSAECSRQQNRVQNLLNKWFGKQMHPTKIHDSYVLCSV